MSKETELQETALGWIAELPKGYFYSEDVDRFLEETFPTECGATRATNLVTAMTLGGRFASQRTRKL